MCSDHQVLKSDVDSHIPRENSVFPHCQLSAECSRKRKKVPKLTHKINMIGAKRPFTYFVINMDPYLMSSTRGVCSLLLATPWLLEHNNCIQLPVKEHHIVSIVGPLYIPAHKVQYGSTALTR